jgi:hypothetical protein
MKLIDEMPKLSYPVLLWFPNVISLFESRYELFRSSRFNHDSDKKLVQNEKTRLFSADGRYFHITDWRAVKPEFYKYLPFLEWVWMGSVPVLENEVQLSLEEFKKKLAWAVRDRYRYDYGTSDGQYGIKVIKEATSYRAALNAVPGFPRWKTDIKHDNQ